MMNTPRHNSFFSRHIRTIGTIAFLMLYSATISFATPPTSPYQPGATLQPSCLPGSTNCTTQILPSQTGNTGKLLTTDGSTAAWTTTLSNTVITASNLALTTNPLSQFAATTSAQLASVISDETGTGTLVYSTSPTLTTPNIGAATGTSLALSGGASFLGNVGVGTASPATAKLVIASDWDSGATNNTQVYLQGATDGNKQLRIGFDTTNNFGYIQALVSGTSTNNLILNASGGNVGIGTTNPASTAKLHIYNSVGSAAQIIQGAATHGAYLNYQNGTSDLYVGVNNSAATLVSGIGGAYGSFVASYGAYPLALGTNGISRFSIDSSGNISIPDLAGVGNRCVYADATGQINVKGFDCGSASGGDNLGDHTATQNIILGSNWISGDGGSEGIRVDSSGNVGIGTATPSKMFHVSKNAQVEARFEDTSSSSYFTITQGSNSYLTAKNSLWLSANDTLGTGIVILPSGNAGVGTATPDTRFHISGDFDGSSAAGTTNLNKGLTIQKRTGVASDYGLNDLYGIAFTNTSDHSNDYPIAAIYGEATSANAYLGGSLHFLTKTENEASLSTKMTINKNGSVGIGTNAPYSTLDIVSANADNIAQGLTIGGNGGIGGHFYFDTTSATNTIISSGYDSALSKMTFRMRDLGTDVNAMTILGSGNVGIGTATPNFKLEVLGSMSVIDGSNIFRNTSSTGYATLRLYNDQNSAGRSLEIDYSGSSYPGALVTGGPSGESASIATVGAYPLTLGTNNAAVMMLSSGGNVGIGTTGFTYGTGGMTAKFAVAGSAGTMFIRSTGAELYTDNVNAYFGTATAGYSTILTSGAGTTALTIDSIQRSNFAGNIGIQGTPSVYSYSSAANPGITFGGSRSYIFSLSNQSLYLGSNLYYDNGWGRGGYTAYGGVIEIAASDGSFSYSSVPSGSAGAGGLSPNRVFKVDVNGNPTFAGLISCGGIQTNGSGTMSCTSDETLKDKHGAFTKGLAAIRQINPESFSWKQDSGLYDDGIIYYGFIAQNVQAVLPEAISISTAGKLQVSQLTLLATTINAVKELDIKVQSLPDFTDQSLAVKIADFLRGIAEQSAAIVDKVQTKQLCVDDVCVTRDQFLQMVQQGTGSQGGGSISPAAQDPSTDSGQATCTDGIQNQDETGVDTGGVCDVPPPADVPPPDEGQATPS